ncbi:DUF6528 family protein [Streptomyces boninensis]|uniref:DUF6528 family protein n=1 Tax=Streptomyces boninensis TaxID=2039455 RepID=UPI003B20DF93
MAAAGTGRPTRRGVLTGALGAAGAIALAAPQARAAASGGRRLPHILVGDQATRSLLLLDSAKKTWDLAADPAAALWRYTPDGDPQFADLQYADGWRYVSEVKVRRHGRKTYVLATASFGLCFAVEYPTGKRYWGAGLGLGDDLLNPHSIELLPNGNIAVAGSTGGLVRIYAASQGPANTTYAEAKLPTAHGVVWDERRDVLWAIGHDDLVAYRIGGTRAAPTIKQVFSTPLPGPDGHDLFPVAGRPDRMWVTVNGDIFQYSKRRKAFLQDFPWAAGWPRNKVKAAGVHPDSGTIVTTQPEPNLGETWWTERVRLHPEGEPYHLVGGGIYKARLWQP